MSISSFFGRTADILAFHGDFPADRELLTGQTLVPNGTGGYLCTGIQKLAQRLLLILLTKQGSRKYRPGDGTRFMTDATRGHWRTPADLRLSFSSARLDFMRQLQAMELASDPADERVESVELLGTTLLPDKVALQIKLTSKAGSGYTFLTPITVPIK